MPVESFELFRRVATDAMATLDLAPVPTAPGGLAEPRGPVSPACATLPAVTTVPAARGEADPPPAAPLTAEDLVAATGGALLRRSDRPVRGGAVDSRLVTPGCLFVALPGERTDGHRFLAAATAAGAARAPRQQAARGRGPGRARRRHRGPGVGRPGGSPGGRGRVAQPLRPPRRRHHGQRRQDLHEGRHGRGPGRRHGDPPDGGQPEQRGRPPAHAPASRAGAPGGRPRDGDVRRRRDRARWLPWGGRRSGS